jgi:membrane-bound serine protease (ClpP class)
MVVVGVALVLVGAALLVAEAHAPGGVLGAFGSLALVGGAALAITAAGGGLALVLAVMLAAGAVAAVWVAVAVRKGFATQRLRASAGREALSGRLGVVRNWTADGGGQVLVDGALWRARQSWADGEDELQKGDPVVVERVSGLTLAVRRAEDWEEPW